MDDRLLVGVLDSVADLDEQSQPLRERQALAVAVLRDAVAKVAQDPEFVAWAEGAGFVSMNLNTQESEAMLEKFQKIYADIAPYVKTE